MLLHVFIVIFRLESLGQFERAAAVAVFNMKLGRAIEVLHKGSKSAQSKLRDPEHLLCAIHQYLHVHTHTHTHIHVYT